jgi:gas vesicle protein
MAFESEFGNDMPIIKGVVRNINAQIQGIYKRIQRQFELSGKVTKTIKDQLGEVQTMVEQEAVLVKDSVKEQVKQSVIEAVQEHTKQVFTSIEEEINHTDEDTMKAVRKAGDTFMMANNLQEEMIKVRQQ